LVYRGHRWRIFLGHYLWWLPCSFPSLMTTPYIWLPVHSSWMIFFPFLTLLSQYTLVLIPLILLVAWSYPVIFPLDWFWTLPPLSSWKVALFFWLIISSTSIMLLPKMHFKHRRLDFTIFLVLLK
jgi:hypothetical protein